MKLKINGEMVEVPRCADGIFVPLTGLTTSEIVAWLKLAAGRAMRRDRTVRVYYRLDGLIPTKSVAISREPPCLGTPVGGFYSTAELALDPKMTVEWLLSLERPYPREALERFRSVLIEKDE